MTNKDTEIVLREALKGIDLANEDLHKRIEQLENENDRLKDCLYHIKKWTQAYPLDVFPEPDFKKANEVLKQNGMGITSISASNMRHVLRGIEKIIVEHGLND